LPKDQRVKRISIGSVVRRDWMVLVAVIVVAGAGFGIYRLHGIFGSNSGTSANSGLSNEIVPFNPKQVVLEVFGAPGATATINYLDVNATLQQVSNAPLPWTLSVTTTLPSVSVNVVAQGDTHQIGCRITVNDVVKDERSVDELNAQTFCIVKSA